MKLVLLLITTITAFGCQESNPTQSGQGAQRTPKTSFGQAIDSAKQVDNLNNQHNQALKEQAEGL
jgi:hypothetical protein